MDALSIVVPARNEERFIGACLESIRASAAKYAGPVEIIVVLNRCTDRTEEIALTHGARIIREDAKNLAKIRNAGARAATGRILITIDADSTMTPNALASVEKTLSSGKIIGGGTWIQPERFSLGILITGLLAIPLALYYRVSCGMFWCYRQDFEAIGGFNEAKISVEDIDFALRLKARGKLTGRRYSTLRGGYIVTSCRKLDKYGDWALFTNPRLMWRLLRGNNQPAADEFYYEIER